MEQNFYVAERGNPYLTLATEPGEVTEHLIVSNLCRMMELDQYEDEETDWVTLHRAASEFYNENEDRILEMAHTHTPLVEISQEQAEEIQGLSFEEWEMWEFQSAEWD